MGKLRPIYDVRKIFYRDNIVLLHKKKSRFLYTVEKMIFTTI